MTPRRLPVVLVSLFLSFFLSRCLSTFTEEKDAFFVSKLNFRNETCCIINMIEYFNVRSTNEKYIDIRDIVIEYRGLYTCNQEAHESTAYY